MLALILALLAAFCSGLSIISTRNRIAESNFFSASLVITMTGNIILWPIALLFTNWGAVNLQSLIVFAIAGMLAPGIFRLIMNKGIELVGASVAASIVSTSVLFTSMFAVLLLDETLASQNWIGITFISVGLLFFEISPSKRVTENGSREISAKSLIFLLLGALIAALAFILRKYALNICSEPLFGIATSYSSALLVFLLLLGSSHSARGFLRLGRDFGCFWKAGVFVSIGWILTFYALNLEKVSIVVPLLQTYPLLVLLLARLYLKEREHISHKAVMSCVLVAIGAVLIGI